MSSMWKYLNENPTGRSVGDCSVRAVSVALGVDWETAYWMLAEAGALMGDMPSADATWGAVLRQHGFSRMNLPDRCPECYTAEDFCMDHPRGVYVLGFGGHVATVIDGVLLDAWDSSQEIPQFVWYLREG